MRVLHVSHLRCGNYANLLPPYNTRRMIRAMNLSCYICDGPGPTMEFLLGRVSPLNACWGLCKVCGIAVCTGHGFRSETPDEYQCALCVGPGIKRRGGGGNGPQQPVTPGPSKDEFLRAYSELRIEILDAIRSRLDEYFSNTFEPFQMDRRAREIAAAAFEEASGVAEFRIRLKNAILEISGA
jgi:hypothetical protein